MTNAEPRLRADARRNLERICAAASEQFAEHGLDVPLEEIARVAGVSIGTIYNRFGGRGGLLDAVVVGVAEDKLEAAIAAATGETAWDRFASYVWALGENQDQVWKDYLAALERLGLSRDPRAPRKPAS